MEPAVWIALFIANFIAMAAPGPCVALTISRSVRGGIRAGFAVSLGIVAAVFCALLIALGVMAGLVMISDQAYSALRWIGCAVLLLLSAAMVFGAPNTPGLTDKAVFPAQGGFAGDFVSGVVAGFFSPYLLIYMLAFFPQAIPANALTGPVIAGIVILVVTGALAVQLGWTLLACCSRSLGGDRCARLIELACAGCLVFFAGTTLFA